MTFVVVCQLPSSKPDTHSPREDVSDKQGSDLASLHPLNIVKDYAAGLMDVPLLRRLRDTHRNKTHNNNNNNNLFYIAPQQQLYELSALDRSTNAIKDTP